MKQLATLADEAKMLEMETAKGGELQISPSSSRSPRQVPSPGLRGSALSGQRDFHGSSESFSSRTVASPGSRSRTSSS